MSVFRTKSVTLPAAAGGAGVATANIDAGVAGVCRLVAVRYLMAGTEAATTTITLTCGGRTVAKKAAGATTVFSEPTVAAVDNTGTATTTLLNPLVYGKVNIASAAANNGDAPTVILILDEA